MELGTVISTMESPTTREFAFVFGDGIKARKGEFVQLNADEGIMIALITEISRANRYFERAESISEYQKASKELGTSFTDSFPAGEWEYTLAQCAVMGCLESGIIRRVGTPPKPGEKVFEADEALLKQLLSIDDNGLGLGRLLQHDVQVKLNLSKLLQKHLAVLAMSGAGKSYFASVLLEELLDRGKEKGRIAVVAFDPHGEYVCFADRKVNPSFAEKTTVIDGRKVRISAGKLKSALLREYLPEITPIAARECERVVGRMKKSEKEQGISFSLEDVVQEVEKSDLKENVKQPLLSALYELRSLRLFSRADYPSLKELVQPGKLLVIDLSAIDSMKRKQVIVDFIGKKLFNGRRKGKLPPYLLLVEEAHNFAQEKAPRGASISKSMIEKTAREGRKFGASLCLVSQRPVHLSTTALSQCNTFVVLRVTNPFDLQHIGESCEAIDSNIQGQINSLKTGEAIIMGEAVPFPIFVKVRERKSRKSSSGEGLESIALRFEREQVELSHDDMEAFL